MNHHLKNFILGITTVLFGLQIALAQDTKFMTIGTAGQTGIYYVVGQSICKLVNRNADTHGMKCTAPSSGGSIANLNAIASGDMNMGIVQSDWQYHAFHGTSTFEPQGSNPELRAIFSAHPDIITVLARKDANVKTLTDLKGKRVNIGNPGSGARASAEVVMETVGIKKEDFSLASELKSSEQSQALCDNNIDVIIFAAGHPVGNIKEATVTCDTDFIPVEGPEIEQLVSERDYYADAVIPGKMYRGQDEDVKSFGALATFVTSTATSEDMVYEVVKTVFENFERFKKFHPAFANLVREDMIKNGLSAPLHDGAIKYYKEQGWM